MSIYTKEHTMPKTPSYWTQELFNSLEVGESHKAPEGKGGATHRAYLMSRILAPKKFISLEKGTKVERVA